MEVDHYVTRREMVKFMTLGSFLLAGANWITILTGKLLHRDSIAERDIGVYFDSTATLSGNDIACDHSAG